MSGSGDQLLLICNLLRQIHFVRTDVSINSFLPGLCSLNWKLIIAGHRAVLVEVEVSGRHFASASDLLALTVALARILALKC